MKIKVLFVDDEANNLTSFKASFRQDYDIVTASSAKEAKALISDEEFHVILADQRMPEQTGVEFFEEIKDSDPNPIRILITGYADIEAVIDSINKGQVFRYISKPWKEDDIHSALEHAYRVYQDREERNFFIFKASHDLRGPLASMKGLINFIEQDITEGNDVEPYLRLLKTSVSNLDETLSVLLDFKRLEKQLLNISDLDFNNVIEQILGDLQFMEKLAENNIHVDVNQKDHFHCDKNLVIAVMTNVIQNSIKYGRYHNNSPRVDIKVNVLDNKANIQIIDNGIGMSPEEIASAFNMFYRANETVKGSGLGLYIVKKSLEKLDGQIKIDSTPGQGSTFNIEIPELQTVS